MLADHVEAEGALHLDVAAEGEIGGRGINAIWPKPLVQGAKLEEELIVKKHFHEAIVRAEADLSHAEVAGDRIDAGDTV